MVCYNNKGNDDKQLYCESFSILDKIFIFKNELSEAQNGKVSIWSGDGENRSWIKIKIRPSEICIFGKLKITGILEKNINLKIPRSHDLLSSINKNLDSNICLAKVLEPGGEFWAELWNIFLLVNSVEEFIKMLEATNGLPEVQVKSGKISVFFIIKTKDETINLSFYLDPHFQVKEKETFYQNIYSNKMFKKFFKEKRLSFKMKLKYKIESEKRKCEETLIFPIFIKQKINNKTKGI